MNTREKQRLRMTRDVLSMVRRRDFRAALPPLTEDGIAPVVIGFRDDTIADIMRMINEVGGEAHVVIPPQESDLWPAGLALLHVQRGNEPAGESADGPEDECEVRPESHLGMLLALLMMNRRLMTFRVCRRETTVQLVDDGKDLVPQ